MALNIITLELCNEHRKETIDFPIELLPIIRCNEIIEINNIKFQISCIQHAIKINLEKPKKPIITFSGKFIEG